MKLLIEVSGGSIVSLVATEECSIYIVYHDNLKEREEGGGTISARQAMQPFLITGEGGHIATPGASETPDFDAALDEALREYETTPEQFERGPGVFYGERPSDEQQEYFKRGGR